jgi:hypothetical protein
MLQQKTKNEKNWACNVRKGALSPRAQLPRENAKMISRV